VRENEWMDEWMAKKTVVSLYFNTIYIYMYNQSCHEENRQAGRQNALIHRRFRPHNALGRMAFKTT